MRRDERQDHLVFINELTHNISSSLDLAEAWQATFKFLAAHFPIDGISLHRFDPILNVLHLQFLVTEDRFHQLNEFVQLSSEEVEEVIPFLKDLTCYQEPNALDDPVSTKHAQATAPYLPVKPRAYLLGGLKTEKTNVGELCLIGEKAACFTDEHEQKLKLMLAPVSLAMINMQQYRHTQELKERLDAQRKNLAGEINLLKKNPIIGAKGGLYPTLEAVRQLAGKETQVLILGETGTGKEIIADAVQQVSPRADKPYVKVNCGAIPDTLIDSELFGYQKGAFTGALADRAGRFEQAHGGTLFLDEIGELPLMVQTRLLRVLQNKTIERVGGGQAIPVDVRIIAATNRPLREMVQSGTFREDLFYRLNVFPVSVPPLRERTGDIPLLIHHFTAQFAKKMGLSGQIKIKTDTIHLLQQYPWPGNVRELENLVERALTIDPDGPLDLYRYLPGESPQQQQPLPPNDNLEELIRQQVDRVIGERFPELDERALSPAEERDTNQLVSLDDMTRRYIQKVIRHCGGKVSGPGGAAEILKINHNTLRNRMRKLGIKRGY